MRFILGATHDELTYIATIRNNGTLPAKIIKVLESPSYNEAPFDTLISPVTITLSDIEDKIIEPEEELELRIVVYYNPATAKVNKKVIHYNLGLLTKSIYK